MKHVTFVGGQACLLLFLPYAGLCQGPAVDHPCVDCVVIFCSGVSLGLVGFSEGEIKMYLEWCETVILCISF